MLFHPRFSEFLPVIKRLNDLNTFDRESLLSESLLLEKDNKLAMYYAPHNEYINPNAKIVIIGITPGWQQMKTAIRQVAANLHLGLTEHQLLREAKLSARFSGLMRSNLITMLDQCGLQHILGIQTTKQLFTTHHSLLHTTSVIRYPVFYKDKNYTGHTPTIKQSTMLKHYAYEIFPEELKTLKNNTLIVPLGKVVDNIIQQVSGELNQQHTYLYGFPHPSGANGHRGKQFLQNYSNLKEKISHWGMSH